MKKTKPVIEVGQTVYVNVSFLFVHSEPKLYPYIVTRVNTKSFYAKEDGDKHEVRFDKKSMSSRSTFGVYRAYLTEKEYWDMIELAKEKETLRREIVKAVNSLGIEKLREIKTLIASQ